MPKAEKINHRSTRTLFQVVLSSAWISKTDAQKYAKDNLNEFRAGQFTFLPPVRYETVVIGDSTPYKRRERAYSGDDSMFHARNKDMLVFGVADGVGGWRRRGINSAIFSRSLTAYSAHAVARVQDGNPKEIMHKAVAAMKYDDIPVYGSSTETIASLSLKTGTLHLAQLGDSRSIVLNCRQEAVFVSQGQVHSPNMPYQISFSPPKDTSTSYGSANGQVDDLCYYRPRKDYSLLTDGAEREIIRNLKRQKTDTPRDALEEIVCLAHNNMVIIATDGLFDNMDVKRIEKLARKYVREPSTTRADSVSLTRFTFRIVQEAVFNYLLPAIRPGTQGSRSRGVAARRCKPDDTTVMVAWVQDIS